MGTKIYEQSVRLPRGLEIAHQLSNMFGRERLNRFQLYNQLILYQKVGSIVTDQCAILIVDGDGMLLLHPKARLPQPVRQRIFVWLFQVAMPVIRMNFISSLSNKIAK